MLRFGLMLSLLLAGLSARGADTKIALVDMQKAIESTADGKKAKSTLEAEYKRRKADLDKEEAEVRKLQAEYEKKVSVYSDEVRKSKQQELGGKAQKFQELVQKNQQEMAKRQGELIQPITTKLRKLIEETAKAEGFQAVLEKSESTVFYASSSVDLTDRLVKKYDSK